MPDRLAIFIKRIGSQKFSSLQHIKKCVNYITNFQSCITKALAWWCNFAVSVVIRILKKGIFEITYQIHGEQPLHNDSEGGVEKTRAALYYH